MTIDPISCYDLFWKMLTISILPSCAGWCSLPRSKVCLSCYDEESRNAGHVPLTGDDNDPRLKILTSLQLVVVKKGYKNVGAGVSVLYRCAVFLT